MLFSDLPPEIQDEIFEWAASMHAEDCFTLSLISKCVQARVEKIMYESLYLFYSSHPYPFPVRTDKVARLFGFLDTIESRPAHFFATHVRNIYFQPDTSDNDVKLVLEKCSGLRHLGFLKQSLCPDPDFATWIYPSATTLQSLMTTKDILNGMAESSIVFPRIRYLVVSMLPYVTSLTSLEYLPALNIVEMFLDTTPSDSEDTPWDKDAEVVLSSASKLQFLELHTHRTCVDIVKQWKETIVSPVRIKIRRDKRYHDPFPAKWERLTTGAFNFATFE